MPCDLVRSGSGWKVRSKDTGKTHSNKPLPEERAKAQMRALYANVPDARGEPHRKAHRALGPSTRILLTQHNACRHAAG